MFLTTIMNSSSKPDINKKELDIKDRCKEIYKLFCDLINAGFTEMQAIQMMYMFAVINKN